MIKIQYLCEYNRHIPTLAQIWKDSIGSKWCPDVSLAQCEESLALHLHDDCLPLTYIALDSNKPIGMCSLRSDDGLRQTKRFPWLGSLCIQDDYRKRGIGKLLIQVTKNKAKQMGFKKLYLFTFEQSVADWYTYLGWVEIEKSTFKDHPIIIMSIAL
jgi:GNAT superfamily N-acetyltransferase